MKYLIITDTHIGATNSNQRIMNAHSDMWKELFKLVKEHDIKHIIHGGDFFDNRQSLSIKTLKHIQEEFIPLMIANPDVKLHIILGNHDILYRNRLDYNSVEPLLSGIPNIHIYSEFTELNEEILLCNWIVPTEEEKAVKLIKKSKLKYCIGHFELLGFEVTKGITSFHGLESKVFNKFNKVLSGHYHRKSTKGNIHYLGTPLSLSFGEYDTEHGYHILDTEKDELIFIPSKTGHLHHQINYDVEKDAIIDIFPSVDNLNELHDKFVRISYTGKETQKLRNLINELTSEIKVNYIRIINNIEQNNEKFDKLLLITDENDLKTSVNVLSDLTNNIDHLINQSLGTVLQDKLNNIENLPETLDYMKELLKTSHEKLTIEI